MPNGNPPTIDEILLQNLTEEQNRAATDEHREILAIACAGSGKSRTLAFRIAWLVARGVAPESIVAFTFTEKAADTIKRRVSQALAQVGIQPTVLGAMYIGTIHSYCQHLLGQMNARYRQFDVLDDNRLVLFLMSRYPEIGIYHFRPDDYVGRYFRRIHALCDAWKTLNDERLNIADVQAVDPPLGMVLENIAAALDRDEYLDFSTMIRRAVDALEADLPGALRATESLKHLMVDEYQDVNPCQEVLIRLLHRRLESLFVVGDDDQSVYAWRGADVSNILSFKRRNPECAYHNLNVNFRSTSAIVSVADAFVAAELGASRITKNPRADHDNAPRDFRALWFDTRQEEAEWVAERIQALLGTVYVETNGEVRGLTPADFAILMRSTRRSEQDGAPKHLPFTHALTSANIPFSLAAGGGPFDRPQVAEMRDTFELLRDIPTREIATEHFQNAVLPRFPHANFDRFVACLTEWGRLIHTPPGGARRRVYPQQLVHDILEAYGLHATAFPDEVMRDIGLFSRMILDVEAVYMSVDSTHRFREILNFLGNVANKGYDMSTDDVLVKPDTVTVSTVHHVKGLEFPVVFVVDVEAQRFPGRRRSYEGVLPQQVIQQALNRGAYHSTPDEEARLFFTALTRSERYLYVSGAESIPGGKRPRLKSRFMNRITHQPHPEVSTNAQGIPADLRPHERIRRVDETVVPTSFSQIRYYLKCPKDYQFRERFGFSPPVPPLFGYGQSVHTIIEKLHEEYQDRVPSSDEAVDVSTNTFHLKHVPESRTPGADGPYERARNSATRIATQYVNQYQDDFNRRHQIEARFEIPVQNAVIAGSIDLLLREDDDGHILDAEVIDFKTIEGGDEPTERQDIEWTELSLQVQLYAKAARDVLGENARTGNVHLLRDNIRVEVPISDDAVTAAVGNVEWAVQGILAGDFPMRPQAEKCKECDFRSLCPKTPQEFRANVPPPPAIHTPTTAGQVSVRAIRDGGN